MMNKKLLAVVFLILSLLPFGHAALATSDAPAPETRQTDLPSANPAVWTYAGSGASVLVGGVTPENAGVVLYGSINSDGSIPNRDAASDPSGNYSDALAVCIGQNGETLWTFQIGDDADAHETFEDGAAVSKDTVALVYRRVADSETSWKAVLIDAQGKVTREIPAEPDVERLMVVEDGYLAMHTVTNDGAADAQYGLRLTDMDGNVIFEKTSDTFSRLHITSVSKQGETFCVYGLWETDAQYYDTVVLLDRRGNETLRRVASNPLDRQGVYVLGDGGRWVVLGAMDHASASGENTQANTLRGYDGAWNLLWEKQIPQDTYYASAWPWKEGILALARESALPLGGVVRHIGMDGEEIQSVTIEQAGLDSKLLLDESQQPLLIGTAPADTQANNKFQMQGVVMPKE